jgi:hypothetical protein
VSPQTNFQLVDGFLQYLVLKSWRQGLRHVIINNTNIVTALKVRAGELNVCKYDVLEEA